jgi:FlaA1/EpsC-like NDP-sugar epimerase
MKKHFFKIVLQTQNRYILLLDILILLLSPLMSLILRLETFSVVDRLLDPLIRYTVIFLLLRLGIYKIMNFYKYYWRYASVDEVVALVFGSTISWFVCTLIFFAILKPMKILPVEFPNSIPFIDGIITMVLIGAVRLGIRVSYVLNERRGLDAESKKVLIVGAGIAGSMIVKELRANPHLDMRPVAFVDDDATKQNANIHGVPVLGRLIDIPKIVREHNINEVIIAMPTVSGKVIRDVVTVCNDLKVKNKTIPGVFEILSGSAVAQLREIQIEDLLRRDIVMIDEKDVEKLIQGTCVMVTGAGGSIGSELCRQISRFRPKELIMLGHGENTIFNIANEMKTKHGVVISQAVKFKTIIADIRDRERMSYVMEKCKPQIIFHAAAHKHVGLMEENAPDAVSNNVSGTHNLVELAAMHNVQKFVMISTDKAVNPTSVMGVTKRIAELLVHDAAERYKRTFVVVRFGNVLGSRGSVVPIFKKQIDEGGPITITHPDVTRFFMTIPEAVRLVLQAGALGSRSETFVLDMGQPVKIVELARDLIRLSGLEEGTDIDIAFTGLKDGEKMHEELFYDHELADRSNHEKIFVCKDIVNVNGTAQKHEISITGLNNGSSTFLEDIQVLVDAAKSGKTELVYQLLKKIVPQYSGDEGVGNRSEREIHGATIKTTEAVL